MNPWPGTQAFKAVSERAHQELGKLQEWLWTHVAADDCLPRQLPPDVHAVLCQLSAALDSMITTMAEAEDRLLHRPLMLFMGGYKLTHEQYHALAAMGVVDRWIVHPAAANLTDYEVFEMFHYEGDTNRCYINPDESSQPEGGFRFRFGRPPEEMYVEDLRPEQSKLFRQIPELYVRLASKKDKIA